MLTSSDEQHPADPDRGEPDRSGETTEWSIARACQRAWNSVRTTGDLGHADATAQPDHVHGLGQQPGASVNTFNLTVVHQVPDELTLPSFDISATNNLMMPPSKP